MPTIPRLDPDTARDLRAIRTRLSREFPGADALLRAQTSWASLWDMLRRERATGYVPSCRLDLHPDQAAVADIFDRAMALLGDPRRAIRWYARGAGRRAA